MLRSSYGGGAGPRNGRTATLFDDEMIQFLEGGTALIVGAVDPDDDPLATRGWGLAVLATPDGGARRVRVLVPDDDAVRLGLTPGAAPRSTWVAVTAADVRTLDSVQLKGPVVSVESVTADDEERCERYCTAYFGAVDDVDGFPPELMSAIRPDRIAAIVVEVSELYDQTPGPGAGAPLGGGR